MVEEQINTEREKQSIQAQENERNRITKGLHGDLGGNMAVIKLKMEFFADQHADKIDQDVFSDIL